jgi:type VI protein secretion system component VasF
VRLADCFIEPLAYVLDVARAPASFPDYEATRAKVEELLNASARLARKLGVSAQEFLDARFAVCAWMDEAVLGSSWSGRDLWLHQPLQRVFYDTVNAGEEYFARLGALLREAGIDPDAPVAGAMTLATELSFGEGGEHGREACQIPLAGGTPSGALSGKGGAAAGTLSGPGGPGALSGPGASGAAYPGASAQTGDLLSEQTQRTAREQAAWDRLGAGRAGVKPLTSVQDLDFGVASGLIPESREHAGAGFDAAGLGAPGGAQERGPAGADVSQAVLGPVGPGGEGAAPGQAEGRGKRAANGFDAPSEDDGVGMGTRGVLEIYALTLMLGFTGKHFHSDGQAVLASLYAKAQEAALGARSRGCGITGVRLCPPLYRAGPSPDERRRFWRGLDLVDMLVMGVPVVALAAMHLIYGTLLTGVLAKLWGAH